MAPSTSQQESLEKRLRALPAHAPDSTLDTAILLAARDALDGRASVEEPVGWLGRFAVSTLLSAATLSYLWWAVSAASALYL